MKYLFSLLVAILLMGCSSSKKATNTQVEIPKDRSWAYTINYKFSADVTVNRKTLECQNFKVEVRPQSKLYLGDKPPEKFYAYDRDCENPLRFEYFRYLDEKGWHRADHNQIQYMGIDFEKILFEVESWLFQKGYL